MKREKVIVNYIPYMDIIYSIGSCKSLKNADFVMPTKVGIQSFPYVVKPLDSRFHGNDDFCKSLGIDEVKKFFEE